MLGDDATTGAQVPQVYQLCDISKDEALDED